MQSLTREQFATLLKQQRVKSRLVRDLRFAPEDITNWEQLEMLAVSTRSKAEGILLVQTTDFYLFPYELTVGLKDKATGRTKPVTCDFCYTWQQGSKAGRITFRRTSDDHTFTYLCCADLQCSLHVRTKTVDALLSRTQLREDMTDEQRVLRLEEKLQRLLKTIAAQPIAN